MKLFKPETKEKFDEIFDNHHVILVQFSASWCGPCTRITPQIKSHLEKLETENAAYIYCDIDKSFGKEIAIANNVKSIPTFKIYSSESKEYIDTLTSSDCEKVIEFTNKYIN